MFSLQRLSGIGKVMHTVVICCCVFVLSALPVLAAPYGTGIYGTGAYNVGDGTAPAISLTALSPDPNTDTTPALTGTATDAEGTVTAVQFQMDGTGGSWSNCTADDGTFDEASEAFTCTVASALTDGSHTMHVRATDSNGNTTDSGSYATDTFTIDTTAPGTPGSPTTTSPTNSTTQTWTFSAASDATSGIASYAYRILDSLSNLITNGTNNTRTVITSLTDGIYTFFVKAIDNAGNQGSESSGTVTVDTTAPTVSSVAASTTQTGATITWTTNEQSSSRVNYGLTNSYGSTTSETDTSPRVTSHSVSVSGLTACTTYHYRVRSIDAVTNEQVGSDNTFTTAGCAGSALVDSQTQSAVTTASGGSVSLIADSKGITLDIPASFAVADANFQIKQIEKSAAQTETALPTGKTLVASYLYDLKALSDVSTKITSFNQPITITMTYGASEIATFDVTTLKIWRWDGTTWHQLSDCVTDTNARTVTCTTTAFSVFGLFGTSTAPAATPTPTPSSSSSSNSGSSGSSGGSSSSSGPRECTGQKPGGSPELFQIDRNGSVATLHVTPGGDPYNSFFVSYGTGGDTGQYAEYFSYEKATGVMIHAVRDLDPRTTYSFRVQPMNGCMAGDWSNTLAAGKKNGKYFKYDMTQLTTRTKRVTSRVPSLVKPAKIQQQTANQKATTEEQKSETESVKPTQMPATVQQPSVQATKQPQSAPPAQEEKKGGIGEWFRNLFR